MSFKEYNALLYKNNSSEGKNVKIALETINFKIMFENQVITLPVKENTFSLGGEDSKFLVISGKEITLMTKETEILDELIQKSLSELKDEFIRLKLLSQRKMNVKKFLPLSFLASIAVIILVVILGFNTFVNLFALSFPFSWEKKIGDAVIGTMTSGKTSDDPELLKTVQNIGNYIFTKSGNKNYQFKFYVVKDKQVNAFALPGGNVVVYTGLLEKSDSPEEVAGVLAHEIQHVYQRHGLKRIVKRLGISAVLAILLGDIGSQVDSIGGELASLKFDRDEEREADRLALELLYNSGISSDGMISFFKKLENQEKDIPSGISLLSTHPETGERINELEKLAKTKYKNLPYKKKFDFDWKKVKEIASKY